ncbi:NAD-dependent epimerase/dehydratase family protein [uncultured Nisaea sp.]|uniref:NAD-dependent epimerase/dehydratase family protein n=1 Tax=uncultured Nisaea sp. TaxID=538215 RepID=UPI0030EE9CE6|tara:strand:+ start:7892 stop:8779 length:888 start_codon:yes stop_codon:yes gene_type:complete
MLKHLNETDVLPGRVAVIGGAGFVGGAVVGALEKEGVAVTSIGRSDIDLLADDATDKLAGLLEPGDTVVFVSAMAPVRNSAMLRDNMTIVANVIHALRAKTPAHLINVSSDAVYRDVLYPMSESAAAEPASLHGAMHLAREVALAAELDVPLGIIRPTLIYGASDPHNGYGPNRFMRLASANEEIRLFGEGEERRDHVLVDDVADLVRRMVLRRSTGVINAATGDVHAFRAIAETVVRLSGSKSVVIGQPRQGAMPHNGYRAFDPANVLRAFPDFRFTPLEDGLKKTLASGMGDA